MNKKLEYLAAEVSKLSIHEQVELAEQILGRLEPVEGEVALAWGREAQRRLVQVRRGECETYDADEVLADARAALRKRRQRRPPL